MQYAYVQYTIDYCKVTTTQVIVGLPANTAAIAVAIASVDAVAVDTCRSYLWQLLASASQHGCHMSD